MHSTSAIFTCRCPRQVSKCFERKTPMPLGSLARGRLWCWQSSRSWRWARPSPRSLRLLCCSTSTRTLGPALFASFVVRPCCMQDRTVGVSSFFPGDQQDTSKTGTQDETVEIGVDKRAWLRGVCSSLHSRRGQAKNLFGLSLPKLQK